MSGAAGGQGAGGRGGAESADVVIVGGGFYGLCLGLFWRSVARRVVVLEAASQPMTRASFVNQARIHSGFHYPRSFVTARRSLALYPRFLADFPQAVRDDFRMLYAIARVGSKVTPERFAKMFAAMGAPIEPARPGEAALFDPARIAAVFHCREHAFDADALRATLVARIARAGVGLRLGATVTAITPRGPGRPVEVALAGQGRIAAPVVINATYGQFACAGTQGRVALKSERAEVALIRPPAILSGLGVTVMDGPFFSIMPFPARDAYSLTHVRYTPQRAWIAGDAGAGGTTGAVAPHSRWLHMARDAARYLPGLGTPDWIGSLYETKTVLLRNEGDDGRPILLDRDPEHPGLITVLGGKLDNIYDLFDALVAEGAIDPAAHCGHLAADGGRQGAEA